MRARAFYILSIVTLLSWAVIAPAAIAAAAKTLSHPVAAKPVKTGLQTTRLSRGALSPAAAHVAAGGKAANKVKDRHSTSMRSAKISAPARSTTVAREVHSIPPKTDDLESDPEASRLRHNPKLHHSAGDKATGADFLPHAPSVPAVKPVRLPVRRPVVVEPPVVIPVVYRRGRLMVPPALKGSHEILVHQNTMADRDGLARVQDDNDLDDLRESRSLVALPAAQGIRVDERLPANRRYCRPWTAQFLAAVARAHYARFHTPLQVNSAVRTVEFQERLILTNGNAAPAEGETASPHLTGQAVDLAKKGLSMAEIVWMRSYLLPLVQAGKVDVEEEFQQACFHISVYKGYSPEPPKGNLTVVHRSATTALAAVVR